MHAQSYDRKGNHVRQDLFLGRVLLKVVTAGTTYFRHFGTSIPEIEIIYHFLSNVLGSVVEEKIATTGNHTPTVIEIHFPFLYGGDFFTLFGPDKWFKLKNVISDMKKRRGKSQMQIAFSFAGVSEVRSATATKLILQTLESDYKNIEKAIDRVETLVELIKYQMPKMPAGVTEMTYSYESTHSRWRPDVVKTDKRVYKCSNDNWRIVPDTF